MSQETTTWLNENVLVGFTEKRGHAWHYRQGADNHYVGAIPVEDVEKRLFHWQAERWQPQAIKLDENGVTTITDNGRIAIVRPDTQEILGYFTEGYEIHQFDEWLLESVSTILDDELSIGSAGLLRKGAVAWVQVEVPENITTPEGVIFRPHLLAATSLDGSLSTTYKRTVTNVVCDNTMAAGLAENGQQLKIRHSRNSTLRLQEARDALAIVHSTADDFAAEVAQLTAIKMDAPQWAKFIELVAPTKDPKTGEQKTGRGYTMAAGKQEILNKLWNTDLRVAPWKNTVWGAVQAVNTATHHEFNVRGSSRAERNMLNTVTGAFEKLDATSLELAMAVVA